MSFLYRRRMLAIQIHPPIRRMASSKAVPPRAMAIIAPIERSVPGLSVPEGASIEINHYNNSSRTVDRSSSQETF